MQTKRTLIAVALIALSVGASQAQTRIFSIDNRYFIPPENRPLIVTGYPLGSLVGNVATWGNITAGVFQLNQYVAAHYLNRAVCVEAGLPQPFNQTVFYNLHYAEGRAGYVLQLAANPTTIDQAVGLQLAIWELENDVYWGRPANLYANTFRINSGYSPGAINYANYLLNNSAGRSAGYYYLIHYTNQAQDLLLVPVPEPASLIALSAGCVSWLALRRRNRKR
ncbi:MAG: hypothetical protein KatS3mg019_0168 [Fimbriimonadales bacterium]|nr:MAG: hypothetical protein KatS3mg019_0168 [Fimbriimonadales bacterium]